MSIKQAIEALEVAQDALDISQSLQESAKSNHHPKTLAAYQRVSADLAALRSMPQGEPVPAKNNDVDLLLRAVFELCEATEEAPQVEPRNEHQRGFDKGRRFEAKAIRRAVGDWFQATFCGQSFMGEPVLTKPEVPHCIDGACHLCATPHTEAVRMSEADFVSMAYDLNALPEVVTDKTMIALCRAVEQATAARLGVKWGDV